MSYESHWSGEIRITPPLTWAEIKQTPDVKDVKLQTDERTEDTPTGYVCAVTAVAIVPSVSWAFNGYEIAEEVQAIIDAHPSHQFSGAITARPTDPDGVTFRYVVLDRIAVEQHARLSWPDGTEVGV
jgi:hypothetical protein